MDEEQMLSNAELLELREKQAMLELGKMSMTDPNRQKVENEVKMLAELRLKEKELEITRLNNNARNEIDEQKVRIEEKKAQNDGKRIRQDGLKFTLGMLAGIGSIAGSYYLDYSKNPFKELKRWGTDILSKISGRW